MTIKLYNAKIQPRHLVTDKTLIATATGTLKNACSIEDPTIERVQISAAPADVNYMEIVEFGRGYFVTDKSAEPTNGFWTISGHVDVLTNAWPQMQSQGAILARQTAKYNLYLPDAMFPLQAKRSPEVKTFPKALTPSQSGACCVLTLIGATTTET